MHVPTPPLQLKASDTLLLLRAEDVRALGGISLGVRGCLWPYEAEHLNDSGLVFIPDDLSPTRYYVHSQFPILVRILGASRLLHPMGLLISVQGTTMRVQGVDRDSGIPFPFPSLPLG